MIDLQQTEDNLKSHVEMLTQTIGERSVTKPHKLEETAGYLEHFYDSIKLAARRENHNFKRIEVANIVAEIGLSENLSENTQLYLLGAHYDSLSGTVGADDNASAIAVQLEVARILTEKAKSLNLKRRIRFVSFALEEPPAFNSHGMSSRVYASKARKAKERIDGMICLEMVGYTCQTPGCQKYPFPLMYFGLPKTGDYIGIVGNFKSRHFSKALYTSFAQNDDLPVERQTVPWSGYLVPDVRLSDHASFWDQGYRAVMITDTSFFRNPYYHTKADTMDKLDFQFMRQLVKSLVIFFTEKNI